MSDNVLVKSDGPITRITLNRPEKRNAMSFELMADLTGTLEAVRHDEDTRVVVIAASGPAFSAGHDLGEMASARDAAAYRRLFDGCTLLMRSIRTIPQPVIAQVHGVATAAGCQLVAACDLAVAEEGARFGTPGVKIGLFCSTPMVPISRAVGRKRALEMLLTGELVSAETALEWGLVNRVVPGGDAAGCGRRPRALDRERECAHHRDRQAGLLRADRPRRAPGLRHHGAGHDDERDDRRRGTRASAHSSRSVAPIWRNS